MENKQSTKNDTLIHQETLEESEAVRNRLYRFQYVTTALSQAVTQEDIAHIIMNLGTATLHAAAGIVCLFDKNKTLYLASQTGCTANQVIEIKKNLESKNTPSQDAIKYKRPIFLHTNEEKKRLYPHTLDTFQNGDEESSIAIPLLIGKNVLGVVSFAFNKSYSFTSEEQEFMFALIQQCAQALDRARMYDEELEQKKILQKTINRIDSLKRLASMLTKAITSEEMAKISLKEGMKLFAADGGEIAIVSEDKEMIRRIAYEGYSDSLNKSGMSWAETRVDHPVFWMDVVKKQKPVVISQLSQIPKEYKYAREFFIHTGFQGIVHIPLYTESNLEGVFSLYFKKNITLQQDELDFLSMLAQQFAQAYDRGILFESEKKQREHTLTVLTRIASLQSITSLLSQAVTLEEVLQTIVNEGSKILGADGGELALVSPDKKQFQIVAYKGYPKEYQETFLKKWRDFSKEQPLIMWQTIQNKKPVYVSDIIAHKDKPKVVKKFLRMVEFRAVATSPLLLHNQIIGVIQLAFKDIKNFTDEEKNFLHALSLQAAQAIERSRSSDQLRESESRFRTLIENSSDAIVLLDEKGTILYSSPSTQRITGYSPEERLKKSVYTSIYPKDKEKVRKFIHNLSDASEYALLRVQYRMINKDGSIPWMEAVGRNMLDNLDISAVVVNYRDITEQVEAEDTIRQAKDELEAILENVDEAIIVWGPKGNLLYANNAAVSINRFNSKEELYDEGTMRNFLSRFESFFDENGNLVVEDQHPFVQVLQHKKPIKRILRAVFREDHKEQWRMVRVMPILDPQGKLSLIVAVTHDISEGKQQEKIKDEFISTASHELKTPITSAKLYSGILSEKIQQFGDEKAYSMITKLDQQLDRLTKLINDLLDISKIKAGKISLTKVQTPIEKLVKDTVDEMQYTTVTHHLVFAGTSKKMLLLDKERMRQVFVNLISNAIKYSPHADQVDVSVEDSRGGVTICVTDYGVGIAKRDQEKIFEPFYQSESGKFPGLGLGLHISSEIVKRHGGKMWVESTYSRWTKMYVFLPDKQKRYE